MIKTYFERKDLRYDFEIDEEDNTETFQMALNLGHENVTIRVRVFPEIHSYKILGFCESTKIPASAVEGVLHVINEMNQFLIQGCFFIEMEQMLIGFCIGTRTHGFAFSEESFAASFETALECLDTEVAQIIKKAVMYDPDTVSSPPTLIVTPKPSKRNLLSRIFRRK